MALPSLPHVATVAHEAEQAADRAAESRWVEVLARLGFASRGLVHVVIGGLAVRLALGESGGKTVNMRQAVSELAKGGRVPIIVVAFGLAGYGVWRLVQAFADTERKGRKLTGIAKRGHQFTNGLVHFGLALVAVKLAMGISADTTDHTREYAAMAMEQPLGRWAVGAVGGGLIIAAISQIVRAIKAKFAEDFDGSNMRPTTRAIAIASGRVGISLRAVIFGAMGVWMIRAAWHFNPAEAKGLGEALASLRAQPYGSILFMAVAFGILAYALFSFMYAAFRDIGHK